MKNLTKLALLPGFLFLGGVAQATTIPSTISSTLTITTDSHLTGNVTCAVPAGTTCIKFGANNITLKLNGFTIAPSSASCTASLGQNGIDTNGKNNVAIRGAGLVTQFNGFGIVVSGNNSAVEGVAITRVCLIAIVVSGSNNEVEGNSISRAVLSPFFVAPAISISGNGANNGHNRILHNEVGGTGPVGAAGTGNGGITVGAPFGPSPGNLIEANNISGNPDFGINIQGGSTGNIVRRNQALGNIIDGDIFDNNAAGANTYDNNLCQVSNLSGVCNTPLPDIAGQSNFEPDGD